MPEQEKGSSKKRWKIKLNVMDSYASSRKWIMD